MVWRLFHASTFCFTVFEEAGNFSVIMKNTGKLFLVLAPLLVSFVIVAQAPPAVPRPFTPVTQEMLVNPSPDDWLMFSRTYDAQRYSPLSQINKQNIAQLGLSWTRGLPAGTMESIPLVHGGVMYVIVPGGGIQALDATNGDLIWQYKHKMQSNS